MKIAIINFSGNVGKTTIARHLLLPRMPKADLISIESANADEGETDALKGRHFAQLQEAMQLNSDLIVDIGASNIEDLLAGMKNIREATPISISSWCRPLPMRNNYAIRRTRLRN